MTSHFPKDLFTPTEGSNYGLDGYPDMAYGEGVLHQWDNARNLAGIPDGVVGGDPEWSKSAAVDFDTMILPNELSGFEDREIVELSWLDPNQGQDPARLPHQHFNIVPELQEAWGKGRHTDGLHFAHAVDTERARYEASLKTDATAQKKSASDIEAATQRAWRQVTAGASLEVVAKDLAAAVGVDQAKTIFQGIRSEVGLVGHVYVRADAYPKCASGQWSDTVRKQATQAQYVVKKKACGSCALAQSGRCAAFGGRQLVDAVPYAEAMNTYAPRIAAAGVQVPHGGDLKKGLKQALKMAREATVKVEGHHHVVSTYMPGELQHDVLTHHQAQKGQAQALRQAQLRVARYVKENLIRREDAAQIVQSVLDPREMLRRAAALATKPKEASIYSGQMNDVSADAHRTTSTVDVVAAQKQIERTAQQREQAASREGRRAAAIAAKVSAIQQEIERGVRGQVLASFIQRTLARDEVAEASKVLNPILQRTGALKEERQTRTYEAPQFKAAPLSQKAASGPAHGEVQRLMRWARRKMTEGAVGLELDQLLAGRFATSVRTAATNVLTQLRSTHEGLSGHVYVDAEAYATKTGTEGCSKGALTHRANGIPAVLAMTRCAGCLQRKAKLDGTAVCSVYGKPLVASAAEVVTNPAKHQQEMIHIADAPDAEVTASLFANTYDASEFNLGGDSELDHVELSDMPSSEKVGNVFFGGLEWE